jgi:tetratricopeptide (TPR) repeat protein/CheY-like chemotaxis protein
MNKKLYFFVVGNDKVMRRITTDFLRQMVRGGEISDNIETFDSASGQEALDLFEIVFKTAADTSVTFRGEPITPLPGLQGKAIVICDVEMEPMSGRELLNICMDDEIFRQMSFVLMTYNADFGLVSELGELGVTNILTKPLTMDKFSHAIRTVAAWVQSEEHGHYKEVERLLESGQYEEALDLIKGMEQKYTNLKWVILRGRAHLGLNETQSARNYFEQAETGAHIASIIALKHMVELYEASGDTKMAIDNLNKLTRKSPNNVERRLRLSELFIEDNRPDEAKAVIDLLEMEKRIVAKFRTKVADLLEKAGYVEEAANMKLLMIDSQLDNFVFCNNVAVGLRKQGRYESADEIYRKIIKAHEHEPTLWFNRAVNLAAWGRKEKNGTMLREAIDHFRMSLKLSPDYWEADRAIQQLKMDIKTGLKEAI